MDETLHHIASQNHFHLLEAKPLSGGDINEVFLLKCQEGDYVVKVNDALRFPGMFSAEARGLELLERSESFRIPRQIATNTLGAASYLLMEYIPNGGKSNVFWERFAQNLVKLHRTTRPQFGLDHNNYIGSLPQQNDGSTKASEFYISQRLAPQFKMASDNGFRIRNLDSFYKNISEQIPEEAPSLIHGDLWGGNYMVSENGEAVLIDPAVAFAPREMDIAMMKLFGGFSEEVFRNYNSLFPLQPAWENRMSIWQLYYLLVHLNLFGSGYLIRVKSIVSRYS